jgi:hypothetical protein
MTAKEEIKLREILHQYTEWLTAHGYIDSDALYEEPLAIDEYINEMRGKDATD